MTIEEATQLFDLALHRALTDSAAVKEAVAQIHQSGLTITGVEVGLRFSIPHSSKYQPEISDDDFLRAMRIAPDVAPDATPAPPEHTTVRPEKQRDPVLNVFVVAFWFVVWMVLSLLSGGVML